MRIYNLIDHALSNKELKPEYGNALLIESKYLNILFDTGKSVAFVDNAEKMGIDLRCVDAVVISHGHCESTGGLERFLNINKHAPVYIKREAFKSL